MPTPIPIIAASVGDGGAEGHARGGDAQDADPRQHADQRRGQRQDGAEDAAEDQQQDDQRDREPDQLRLGVGGLRPGHVLEPGAVLHLDAAVARGRRRVVQLADVGRAEGRRLDVELDGRVADRAVGRDRRGTLGQRVGHRRDVRQLAQRGDRVIDLRAVRCQRPGPGLVDHGARVAARARGVRLQQGEPGVRLGAGQVHVVAVDRAEMLGAGEQGRQHDDPDGQHPPRVPAAGSAKPLQRGPPDAAPGRCAPGR